MQLFKLFIAVATTSVLGSVASAQWVQWSENGHWYLPVHAPNTISWANAEAAAESSGGYLTTVTSAGENSFVSSLLDDTYFVLWSGSYFGPWLGGYAPLDRQSPADNWAWVTGEEWIYTNWHPGEPSNGGPAHDEDRLQFAHTPSESSPFSWNDVAGSGSTDNAGGGVFSYIVERDTEPVPEPASMACVLGTLLVARRRKETQKRL